MTTATAGQAPSAPTNLEEVFLSLARRWKEERGPSSSTTELAMPADSRGKLRDMARLWIEWGRRHGLHW